MKTIDKKSVLEVLNSLDVVEENGGDSSYILVANNEKNHEALNKVGISSETINKYGDEHTFCILALGYSEGLVDLYDGSKLIIFDRKFEVELEKGNSVVLYKHDGETNISISEDGGSVSTLKLTEEQLQEINHVMGHLDDSKFEVELETDKSVTLHKIDGEISVAISVDGGFVSTLKLTEEQSQEIRIVLLTMNKNQIGDMEHALRNGNRFYTEADNKDWNDLVKKGYATKGGGWEDDMAYFYVTSAGKDALKVTTT